MGAVFLLVLLPLIGALGFMLGTVEGEASGAALLAGGMFFFLVCVITVGVVRMARTWDEAEADR